jgi:hypothetical protein
VRLFLNMVSPAVAVDAVPTRECLSINEDPHMLVKTWLASLIAIVLLCCSFLADAGVPSGPVVQLQADFNHRTPGEALGAGGAALGEPSDLSALEGEILESSPGENYLLVKNNTGSTSGRNLRWDLIDSAEITSGIVRFAFDFTPTALDRYSFGIRESGGSAFTFLSVTFSTSGTLSASDAAGVIAVTNNTYSANVVMHVVISFDMDAGTSDLTVNGNTVFSGRAHGITGRGVGRLLTGYGSGHSAQPFQVDNVVVTAPGPLPLVLDADFDTQAVGQPIGYGGAALGEPSEASPGLTTEVIDAGMGNNILRLNAPVTGSARSLRWQFLDNIEITTGIVAFDLDVAFGVLDSYQILVREAGGSGSSFANLRFLANGVVSLSDGGGTAALPPVTYAANQVYRVRLIYDMDNATYSAMLDDTVLVENRPHGVSTGRGIGAIATGFLSSTAFGGPMFIDALQVGASDAENIASEIAFLVEPDSGTAKIALTPALEVGVLNVFDRPVGDGSIVGVEILSGPAGAALSGAIEPTVGGVARFDTLNVDLPGTYRLRALAGNVAADSTTDIVVSPNQDFLFRNGFD